MNLECCNAEFHKREMRKMFANKCSVTAKDQNCPGISAFEIENQYTKEKLYLCRRCSVNFLPQFKDGINAKIYKITEEVSSEEV